MHPSAIPRSAQVVCLERASAPSANVSCEVLFTLLALLLEQATAQQLAAQAVPAFRLLNKEETGPKGKMWCQTLEEAQHTSHQNSGDKRYSAAPVSPTNYLISSAL